VNKLDDILKSARPSVPELPPKFSERVMSEIGRLEAKSIGSQTRSRSSLFNFIFACLLLLVGLLAFNSILFVIRMNGSLELLSFGTRFLADIFSYIPFDLIIPAVLIVALASRMIWASQAFKKGVATVILGSYVVTGVGGAALATTGVNERIQKTLIEDKRDWPVISWLYKERARYHVKHPNFNMGQVEKLSDGFAWIVDPNGKKIKIRLPEGQTVRKGQFIRLVGSVDNGLFQGHDMNFCHPVNAQRYYQHMPMMHRNMMMDMKDMREHHGMMNRMISPK
jgi:hypothetical protein